MCNLYDLGTGRHRSRDEWSDMVADALEKDRPKGSHPFGIRKTDPGLVIRNAAGTPSPAWMRWGFDRPFNPAINNARSDKLRGLWKSAWEAGRRCVIPIHAFYEWTGPAGNKQAFAFQSPQPTLLWAAGLWEPLQESDRGMEAAYTMITSDASPAVSPVHHRMPALLETGELNEFLEADDPASLLRPFPGEIEIFRCRNPLKHPKDHNGPEREDFLPGFEGIG